MPPLPGKLLQVYASESDRYAGEALCVAIVQKCRDLGIAGATVLRGVEGYGESAALHKDHLLRHDRPVTISIVDTAENLARLMPVLGEMMDAGTMAVSDVTMIRVRKES